MAPRSLVLVLTMLSVSVVAVPSPGAASVEFSRVRAVSEPTNGLVAIFDDDVPDQVRRVAQDVMVELGAVIEFDPAAPVEIGVGWEEMSSLGVGGPVIVGRDGDYYPAALADTLFGGQHAGGSPDGFVTMDSGQRWYFGLDGNVPADRFDFRSAFAHELVHALGFTIDTTTDGNGWTVLTGRSSQFDRNLFSGGLRLADLGPAAQGSAFDRDDVWFDVGGGRLLPLKSDTGRGLSHFGFAVSATDGEPGSLMYAGLVNGVARSFDAPVIGALAQLGYPVVTGPAAPVDVRLDPGGRGATVRWTVNLADSGTPPQRMRVEASLRGTRTFSVELAGAVEQYVIPAGTAFDRVVVTSVSRTGALRSAEVATVRQIDDATTIDELLAAADYDPRYGAVLRLYWAFFNREPDVGGAKYWISVYRSGRSFDDIAQAFATSREFVSRYGRLTNRRFLDVIYLNVLGRPADPGGFDYWLGKLAGGQLDRGGVVRWIGSSPEFVRNHPY